MSGTSLDGLDMAAAEFHFSNSNWNFEIITAETVPYSKNWEEKLRHSTELTGEMLARLHSEYGHFTGQKIKKFIKKTGFKPDIIASHGHTVFHQPEKQFTLQIGNGAAIASETEISEPGMLHWAVRERL